MERPPIDRGEWNDVLELCREKAETWYDDFSYRYELDGEGHLKNLFWAETFFVCVSMGDVVVFDTTYRTNKHGVAFVPFVGLSHHRTPIVLGCGITSDQSLDSLVWLLRAFMESTTQKRPVSVITDDSDVVARAVKTVFPGSNHRFCSWHVEQGIEEHLRGSPAAQNEFKALMCDDTISSPAAFEDRWYSFMAKHRTTANQPWLDAMYGKRGMWAAAFVHGKFFLGMANDQRTECLATALHTGLHDDMSLVDLWRHADACADALLEDVASLDHQAAMSRLALTTEHRRLEEHAARLFTPANFYLLREEIKMLGSFEVLIETRGRHPASGKALYAVGLKQWRRGVVFDVERSGDGVLKCDVLKCSCRKMERDGLPCRHIFCVMHHTSMSQIPDCCVLRRMTRDLDAKNRRLDEMKDLGRQVFDLASEDAQEFHEIKEFFKSWLEEKQRRRGSSAVTLESLAVEDDDDHAADVDSSKPVAKRIKLFDD